MAKKGDNLNLSIFAALKVAEKSKVPTLLLSNPGMGKTSSVNLFCEVRSTPEHPVDVVLLRGNSTSAEEVMGYDVSPRDVTYEKPMSAIHLRPSWFQRVLDNHEKGIRTVLFLDEITTANEFVQAALLHLIFERSCGTEKLPEDTLIVAAGNYIGNLTSSMALLSPVMNRFDIINLLPGEESLGIFLNKFTGALASDSGECMNYLEEIKKKMVEMDRQELVVDEATSNRIGEYIEDSIKATAGMLMKKGDIDMTITDLQDIYTGDDNGDPRVYGFVTFRTLCYLRDVTVAYYKCFGREGLASDNYLRAIEGLCGLGLKRDKSKNDIIKKKIASEFYDAIQVVSADLAKLNNTKVTEYVNFFAQITKGVKEFEGPILQAMTNKFNELENDGAMKSVARPLDPEVIHLIGQISQDTGKKIGNVKFPPNSSILDHISKEQFIGMVTSWNTLVSFCLAFRDFVVNPRYEYSQQDIDKVNKSLEPLQSIGFKLKSINKMICAENSSLTGMIPAIKVIGK